jgi:F-type H+-transporting ATPase subunit a
MNVEISPAAETLFHLGPVPITNTIITTWLVMIVLIAASYVGTRQLQLVPGRFQGMLEAIIEAIYGLVESSTGRYARSAFPLIGTLFLFIVTANWMGLLPGFTPSGMFGPAIWLAAEHDHHLVHIPLLRAPNSDINMTLAMGLSSFVFIHFSGIRMNGLLGYLKHLSTPIFLTPINVVIESFVPVSLSFRLFGNIFGGDVLLTVMALPVVALVFMILEMLFGLIQALIFSILTAIFVGLATAHGHQHDEQHHAPARHSEQAGHPPVAAEPAAPAH